MPKLVAEITRTDAITNVNRRLLSELVTASPGLLVTSSPPAR